MQGKVGKVNLYVIIQLPGESHFSGNLVFSNHCNIVSYFMAFLDCFPVWGTIFFHPKALVIIFQTS